MEKNTYAVEAGIEATHWWFVGRRKLFARELRRQSIPPDASILDIGTGTGTNLRMLKNLGFRHVTGLDPSDEAIRFCLEKGLGHVKKGDICTLPFGDAQFDFVFATDVIEHVDDDDRALAEISRVLKPGGKVLITVPAFQSLWGLQDDVSLHKRRYRMAALVSKLPLAGLRPEHFYYFNFLLFAPIWLARQVLRIGRVKLQSENQLNIAVLNRLLSFLFSVDISLAPYLRAPFGVSILILGSVSSGSRKGPR